MLLSLLERPSALQNLRPLRSESLDPLQFAYQANIVCLCAWMLRVALRVDHGLVVWIIDLTRDHSTDVGCAGEQHPRTEGTTRWGIKRPPNYPVPRGGVGGGTGPLQVPEQ